MSTFASERHRLLEVKLIAGRLLGNLTPEIDDDISEEMAQLWYQMDESERTASRSRVSDYARAMALSKPIPKIDLSANHPYPIDSIPVITKSIITYSNLSIRSPFANNPNFQNYTSNATRSASVMAVAV